jgi:hypothetical protein
VFDYICTYQLIKYLIVYEKRVMKSTMGLMSALPRRSLGGLCGLQEENPILCTAYICKHELIRSHVLAHSLTLALPHGGIFRRINFGLMMRSLGRLESVDDASTEVKSMAPAAGTIRGSWRYEEENNKKPLWS